MKYLGPFAQYVNLQQDKGSPGTLSKLLDFIDDVYEEKITYDEVDDREGVKRHDMVEFVHDHLFRKYGIALKKYLQMDTQLLFMELQIMKKLDPHFQEPKKMAQQLL